jgi:hypothetical protein
MRLIESILEAAERRGLLETFLSGIRRQYRREGYAIFRKRLDPVAIERLAQVMIQRVIPYEKPLLRRHGREEVHTYYEEGPGIKEPVANAHVTVPSDMGELQDAVRAITYSDELFQAMHALDGEERYTICQSLLFFMSPHTAIHIDSWTFDTSPLGYAHSMFIPLENMHMRSGFPCICPWPLGKVISEEELDVVDRTRGTPDYSFGKHYQAYNTALAKRFMSESWEVRGGLLRKGDMMVWSSLTPHASFPCNPFPAPRMSLQLILAPSRFPIGDFVRDKGMDRKVEKVSERFSVLG